MDQAKHDGTAHYEGDLPKVPSTRALQDQSRKYRETVTSKHYHIVGRRIRASPDNDITNRMQYSHEDQDCKNFNELQCPRIGLFCWLIGH